MFISSPLRIFSSVIVVTDGESRERLQVPSSTCGRVRTTSPGRISNLAQSICHKPSCTRLATKPIAHGPLVRAGKTHPGTSGHVDCATWEVRAIRVGTPLHKRGRALPQAGEIDERQLRSSCMANLSTRRTIFPFLHFGGHVF